MVESIHVLRVCRKTTIQARRIAPQMTQMTIVCAPNKIRALLRNMSRMQLIGTLAAWRPIARRYLEPYDEIADLDDMI